MSTPNTSKVKWVAGYELQDRREDTDEPLEGRHGVPVIPLADLTEMVEGLQACKLALESCKDQIRGALPRMEIESAIDEAQRLLTQLEAHRREG